MNHRIVIRIARNVLSSDIFFFPVLLPSIVHPLVGTFASNIGPFIHTRTQYTAFISMNYTQLFYAPNKFVQLRGVKFNAVVMYALVDCKKQPHSEFRRMNRSHFCVNALKLFEMPVTNIQILQQKISSKHGIFPVEMKTKKGTQRPMIFVEYSALCHLIAFIRYAAIFFSSSF